MLHAVKVLHEIAQSNTAIDSNNLCALYTAQLLSRIKRVTNDCDNQSRIVWSLNETSSLLVEYHTLISRQCMSLMKCELKRRRCLEVILVCRLCLAAYKLLEVTAPLSCGQQRSMRRFTIILRSCIKRAKRQVLCLQMFNRTKNTKLRNAILDARDNGYYGRGRDDTSQSATADVAFKDNPVERQRRVVARRSCLTRQ